MSRTPTPFDLWTNAVEAGLMLAEANMIIAMRMMGMGGVWSVPASENNRMVSEKAAAFTRAAMEASFAAMRGAHPVAVTAAALRPVRKATRGNVRRLGRRGLKLP